VSAADQLALFVAFSAATSGFSEFDLHGTGQAEAYRSAVSDIVGADVLDELLGAYDRVRSEAETGGAALEDLLRRDVFSDAKLGPVARNVVKLWYVGIWYALPPEWTDTFGVRENDTTFMVSATAYTEGLLWPAIGANPPGAKAPGYASWTGPPRIAGI
jgi:hypothetical protein